MTLVERWQAVMDRVRQAGDRAGRQPGAVRLIAVSKTKPVEDIRALSAAGQCLFGENRVQEALQKIDEISSHPAADIEWHLIGHLQSNKARQVVGRFALLHGIDSIALAQEIQRRAAGAKLVQPVLIQMNLAGEVSKAGIAAADLFATLDTVQEMTSLELRGLMSIPPPVDRPEESRTWFRKLKECQDAASAHVGRELSELSMGMTDDFEVAIEEGATLVRVGRAIFGERT